MFVYLLISDDNKASYVGSTIDLNRRLRQHNKEISGGAKATSIKVLQGMKWKRAIHISEFPTWQSCLQFEWRWKQLTRKINKKNIGVLERRIIALDNLLSLEKPTMNALKYCEWENLPNIHLETEESQIIYDKLKENNILSEI
jgi:structure-specific endonuclease subunit SLX1